MTMRKNLILAFTIFIVFTVLRANTTKQTADFVSLSQVEALADGEETTLPGVGITCNTGGSGTCYTEYVESIDGTYCQLRCKATGNPDDYCSSFLMGILELCINFF